MWFPWRSARNTADLYVTATDVTRLGGGLPPVSIAIEGADTPDLSAALEELAKPISHGKTARLWVGASQLQAGLIASTASVLKSKDLHALVQAELAERTAEPMVWQIAVTQQTDRSILWTASDPSVTSVVRQVLTAQKVNLASIAPVWSLIDGKNIAANAETLLWWQEADAMSGIHLKNGVVHAIAIATLLGSTAQDAADRLRVRLAASEQIKEFSICLAPAIDQLVMGQDQSATILPAPWQTLVQRKQDDQLNRQAA